MTAIEMLKAAIVKQARDDDTFQQYAFWIRKIYHHVKIPASQWSAANMTKGLLWLRSQQYSDTSQRCALCAVVFFFKHVLKRELGRLDLPAMPKQRKTLKEIPTREEVAQLIMLLRDEFRLMGGLMYGGGTRVKETCMLRVKDFNFDRCEIRIHNDTAKNKKSRLPPLPETMIPALREYFDGKRKELYERDLAQGWGYVELPGRLANKYKSANREYGWQFAFPSRVVSVTGYRWHITPEAFQNELRKARKIAGIIKPVTPHTLRHSFCSHALENGEEFETVRKWMGHEDANTTLIYCHTQHRGVSPMDFGRKINQVNPPPQIHFKN
jgi:site-specific recombinase XerD